MPRRALGLREQRPERAGDAVLKPEDDRSSGSRRRSARERMAGSGAECVLVGVRYVCANCPWHPPAARWPDGGPGRYRALVHRRRLMVDVRQHTGHPRHARSRGRKDRGADQRLGGNRRTHGLAGRARGHSPGAATSTMPRP